MDMDSKLFGTEEPQSQLNHQGKSPGDFQRENEDPGPMWSLYGMNSCLMARSWQGLLAGVVVEN